MDWLNYHHLRYFWTVAREGGLAKAAEALKVSAPSISEQIGELEAALGEKLFRREGRNNRLTDAGQIAYGFADEIFGLGREMMSSLRQRPGAKTLKLHVGVLDSFPKLVTNEILRPVFDMHDLVRVVFREGKMEDLLAQLAAHRLDVVLADEPASSSAGPRCFNHPLGRTGTVFCAVEATASRLRGGFPKSLHAEPALLPSENTNLRRNLEKWFRARHVQPAVLAEFEDLALMKVVAAEGRGFVALPEVAVEDAAKRYGLHPFGRTSGCQVEFHAIVTDRKIVHPAVALLTVKARQDLFS